MNKLSNQTSYACRIAAIFVIGTIVLLSAANVVVGQNVGTVTMNSDGEIEFGGRFDYDDLTFAEWECPYDLDEFDVPEAENYSWVYFNLRHYEYNNNFGARKEFQDPPFDLEDFLTAWEDDDSAAEAEFTYTTGGDEDVLLTAFFLGLYDFGDNKYGSSWQTGCSENPHTPPVISYDGSSTYFSSAFNAALERDISIADLEFDLTFGWDKSGSSYTDFSGSLGEYLETPFNTQLHLVDKLNAGVGYGYFDDWPGAQKDITTLGLTTGLYQFVLYIQTHSYLVGVTYISAHQTEMVSVRFGLVDADSSARDITISEDIAFFAEADMDIEDVTIASTGRVDFYALDSNKMVFDNGFKVSVGGEMETHFVDTGVPKRESFVSEVPPKVKEQDSPEIAKDFRLSPPYPNPFNPISTVEFALPRQARVQIRVMDVLGREVAILLDGVRDQGEHRLRFDTNQLGLSSGIYFIHFAAEDVSLVQKAILLK